MIDYTDVDRQLIYKDRSRLDDFKVNDLSEIIEHQFYRRLSNERFMLQSVDAAKYALDIFNDAYYVCTLFYMFDHPKLYLAKVRGKIISKYKGKYLSTATMSLVYHLLGIEQQAPWGERSEFVKLWFHFIAEDGERYKTFNDFTIAIFPGTQFRRIKYPYTAERFERRDIFEILHADGHEMLCIKDIDYVIEEVMRRKPIEEAVSELTVLRKKSESYFAKYHIMENSDEDFDAWMSARDKIDHVIKYRQGSYTISKEIEEKNEKDQEQVTNEQKVNVQVYIDREPLPIDTNHGNKCDTAYDFIFDKRVLVNEVIKALDKLTFKKNGRVHWYVVYKVFLHLKWLKEDCAPRQFLKWVNHHFKCGWDKEYNFIFSRDVNPTLRKSDISLWKTLDNDMTTKYSKCSNYYNFAVLLRNTFEIISVPLKLGRVKY